MIYSTNRTSSLGGSNLNEIDVNESYFGIGAQDFYQECAQDELSMFEMAIKSDIDEALIGESTYELEALNEGFIESAKKKIIDMMEKFKAWLAAVTRSAFAKLSALLVRDNVKFANVAKKHIPTMKNRENFKYTGKIVEQITLATNWDASLEKLKAAAENEKITMKEVEDLIKECNDSASKDSLENLVKASTKDAKDEGYGILQSQIDALEGLSKKYIGSVKKGIKDNINEANKIISSIKKLKSDDEKEKDNIAARGKAVSAYKANCQAMIKVEMSLLRTLGKIARKPIAKAMGATPKNEGVEFDEELNDALIEAVEYEYDNALEEMSEGCKNESDDDAEDPEDALEDEE